MERGSLGLGWPQGFARYTVASERELCVSRLGPETLLLMFRWCRAISGSALEAAGGMPKLL